MSPRGFWRRPPAWVSFCFVASMTIFAASMLTWREGARFLSRPLRAAELRLVESALALWESYRGPQDQDVLRLRALLAGQRIRAMDEPTFGRSAERRAFGYTDEHGRILLNPRLCFGYSRILRQSALHPADRVATLATLYHEARHLYEGASEASAYRQEWSFVRGLADWSGIRRERALSQELQLWDEQLPCRLRACLGEAELTRVQTALRGADPGFSAGR